jgi:SAM-dependent methyltransferase
VNDRQIVFSRSARVQGAIDLIPASAVPGRALDLSAGDGEATRLLASRGWRVVSTELEPVPGRIAADLSGYVPFKSESFDLVVNLEVIEHLENIAHALREIARVLKAGGLAIISTPNRLNLASRVHYLLTGYYKGRRSPLPYRYTTADGRNWHVMGLNDLHWMAHGAGLRLEALGKSRRRLKSQLLTLAFILPVKLFSWMLYVRNAREEPARSINRELYRFMTSASLLMDENLLMRFRKAT